MDPFVGDNDHYALPQKILHHLEMIGLKTLDQIKRHTWFILKAGYWLNAKS